MTEAPSRPRAGRILLAEDDPMIRRITEMTLRQEGFEVTSVATGSEAVREASEGGHDLLLLDLGLPDVDGVRVVREIRAAEGETGQRLPILVLSGRPEGGGSMSGVDEFLTKPLAAERLVAAILRHLPKPVGSETAADRGEGPSARGFPEGLWREAAALFREDAPEQWERLVEAVDRGEVEKAAAIAHRLIGAAANFGPSSFGERLRWIEAWAEGGDLTAIRRELAETRAALAQLLAGFPDST